MRKTLLASAALLAMTAGVAFAQTTTSQSTTTVTPATIMPVPAPPVITPLMAPPAGTLSTVRTEKAVSADGSVTDSQSSTYRDTNGVAGDSVTKTTTYPAPAVVSTDTTTTTETK